MSFLSSTAALRRVRFGSVAALAIASSCQPYVPAEESLSLDEARNRVRVTVSVDSRLGTVTGYIEAPHDGRPCLRLPDARVEVNGVSADVVYRGSAEKWELSGGDDGYVFGGCRPFTFRIPIADLDPSDTLEVAALELDTRLSVAANVTLDPRRLVQVDPVGPVSVGATIVLASAASLPDASRAPWEFGGIAWDGNYPGKPLGRVSNDSLWVAPAAHDVSVVPRADGVSFGFTVPQAYTNLFCIHEPLGPEEPVRWETRCDGFRRCIVSSYPAVTPAACIELDLH